MRITFTARLAKGDARHAQATSALCDTHHTREICATRIGGHAHRYLAERDGIGRVVSIFRHGLNVVFDEAHDPTWIAVQTPVVPLHPWAVEVPAIPSGIRVGPLVHADGGRMVLSLRCFHKPKATSAEITLSTADGPRTTDIRFEIRTRDATCHELRISPYTPEEAEAALARLPLLEQALAKARALRPADPFQPEIDAILERWQTTGDPSHLADLVGLGSGSTPSGDDVLVGMLAGLTALQSTFGPAHALRMSLGSSLEATGAASRTASASAQSLRAASEDAFPEALGQLLAALGRSSVSARNVLRQLEVVGALGATSGCSFLSGVWAAMRLQLAQPLSPR